MKLRWWKTAAEKEQERIDYENNLRQEITNQIIETQKEQEQLRQQEELRLKAEQEAREWKAKQDADAQAKLEEDARLKAEKELKESQTPWFIDKHIEETDVHGQKRIKVELDWNDAFIKHLRDAGYTGSNDEEVIQKYIALTAREVADDMGNQLFTSDLE